MAFGFNLSELNQSALPNSGFSGYGQGGVLPQDPQMQPPDPAYPQPGQGGVLGGGIMQAPPADPYAAFGGAPRDPEGRTLQDIFANRAGTPPEGWTYQPGDPTQATDQGPYAWGRNGGINPGGQTMPPQAGGVFGGGVHTGPTDSGIKFDPSHRSPTTGIGGAMGWGQPSTGGGWGSIYGGLGSLTKSAAPGWMQIGPYGTPR